jgi:hypothetical protein
MSEPITNEVAESMITKMIGLLIELQLSLCTTFLVIGVSTIAFSGFSIYTSMRLINLNNIQRKDMAIQSDNMVIIRDKIKKIEDSLEILISRSTY